MSCLLSRFDGQKLYDKIEKEVDKMDKQKPKVNGRIRYDNAFKQGAIQMITEQHLSIKEVSNELGVSSDSLRTWLRNYGFDPKAENRDNSQAKRIRELEAQLKASRAETERYKAANEILKKSIGIICNP